MILTTFILKALVFCSLVALLIARFSTDVSSNITAASGLEKPVRYYRHVDKRTELDKELENHQRHTVHWGPEYSSMNFAHDSHIQL